MVALTQEIIDFLRKEKLDRLLNDISLTSWIYRQVTETGIGYIEDMKMELEKTLIINDFNEDIKIKYQQEYKYLNFLIETYK